MAASRAASTPAIGLRGSAYGKEGCEWGRIKLGPGLEGGEDACRAKAADLELDLNIRMKGSRGYRTELSR